MDYNTLLDLATDLGYELAMSGAETFRVEDSITRVLASYGVEAEAFAIPNYLVVSIITDDGKPITRMRRIGYHGNDLDSVEKYNSLSRRICAEKPEPEIAMQWLMDTNNARVTYKPPLYLLGHFLGGAGFSVFFGGTLTDALFAGICGILVGLSDRFLDKFKTNQFFRTIACAFIMTFFAYLTGILNLSDNTDTVIIGALMLLVPGLLFTNAMRDIIFGDTNSGINRIVQVLLIAAGIAVGTGAAWSICNSLWEVPTDAPPIVYGTAIQCIASFVGCFGFCFLFNIHGPGALLCAFGGAISWATYGLVVHLGGSPLMGYFFARFYRKSAVARKKHVALLCVMQVLLTMQQPFYVKNQVYVFLHHIFWWGKSFRENL